MTRAYYRPLVQMSHRRPEGALRLAGGWCWFDRVEVIHRTGAPRIVPAGELPVDVLAALTTPRAPVAGLEMGAPRLMGILNVTPDSFSDGGRFATVEAARAQAGRLVAEGADLLDIGGESTRPGAALVPAEDEIARVRPVLDALAGQAGVPLSIDTRKAAVAEAALAAGAGLVNDVSALTYDPAMAGVVARSGQPVCLMHAQGDPQTMQTDPRYADVLLDVYDALAARIAAAEAAGIDRARIVVDPGIGFGKTLEHNLALLRGLALFHALGCAVLLGVSRKRFIGTITGAEVAEARVAGSVALAQYAVEQGVQFIRVHDILPTKQAIAMRMALN